MYVWSSRTRMTFPRMVWLECNHNEPEYVLHRNHYARGSRLKRYPRDLRAHNKVLLEYPRFHMPTRVGQWPVFQYGRRVKVEIKPKPSFPTSTWRKPVPVIKKVKKKY